ncbi:MAG: NAD-dependent epimerase/dehydratase family protein [Solirubrobacteraceae bacterium]
MRILILGGDGFCGWPTSLHLSACGHDVDIVDNFARRHADVELQATSLTPIESLDVRRAAWSEVSGREIGFHEIDVACDYDGLLAVLRSERPDAVVHFAEQRAAPYSMKSSWHKRYTVDNNVSATHNLLAAIVETGLDTHVVHLGTMGVYGYGTTGTRLPEGYLTVRMDAEDGSEVSDEILYPVNPGSVYHMTKTLDQLMFAFYAKNDGIRVTDLHQGIVWGTQTPETSLDERLINRFDYDGDYGTVLNRFLMQAAIGYPLTVHGTGGQTRAFIHIRDSAKCIQLAVEAAPERGDRVRIFNQMTEVHRVIDLAGMIARMTGSEIDLIENPRKEASHNDLLVANDHLLGLGLNPVRLKDDLLTEVSDIAQRYMHRCDRERIPCTSLWVPRADEEASPVFEDAV